MTTHRTSSTSPSDRVQAAAVELKERLIARGMETMVASKIADAARHRIYVSGNGAHVKVADRDGALLATGGHDPLDFLAGALYAGAPLALQKGMTEEEAAEYLDNPGGLHSELRERERVVN